MNDHDANSATTGAASGATPPTTAPHDTAADRAEAIEEAIEERRSNRRSVIAATGLTLFLTGMIMTGEPWALLVWLAAAIGVDHWDRRLRPDPSAIPVLFYLAGIIASGVIVLIVALLVVVAALFVLT